jgi:hypothetical protein
MKHLCLLSLCAVGAVLCIENDFKGFDDNILFGINWPGSRLENAAAAELNKSQVFYK